MFKNVAISRDDEGLFVFATVDAAGRVYWCRERDTEWKTLPPHPETKVPDKSPFELEDK